MKCSTCKDEVGSNLDCVECIMTNPQIKEGERLDPEGERT